MESKQTGLAFSLPPSPEHVHANSPVEFTHYYFYPSPGARDTVSFGLDDILLTAASDSEDFGPALADALPPSGQESRPSAAYSELVDVHSRSTEKLSLDWPDEPRESQALKLDERFLSGPNSRPKRRKLTFFSDLHQEISRSWKQPFSSRLTNAAAADFTNLVGSVDQGYTAIPVAEDTLASNLSPSLAPSWKSRPFLPTKLCRTTSALIGKSYIAAGQAGMALHTMAILQAYQVNVLKEMDEGTGLTPEAVKELLRATDLALRATKHTARAVGRSMAGSVAAERHLWLNLTEIREKEKVFLLDAPISQSGLFGEAVSSVVEKFRSAKTQSAALKQFMPRRIRDHSTPSSSLSREQSLPRKEPSGRSVAQAAHFPPTMVWGARGWPFPRQRPCRRVDLKRPSRPAASHALPGTDIEAVCGSLQSLEKILPIAGVFWCCRRGLATSKQRISHWVRGAISLAYEARNLPSPLSLLAHSTRGVASSQALFRGVPLEDICVAAGWSSPHTFVRFYNLDIDTAPGSQVLSV